MGSFALMKTGRVMEGKGKLALTLNISAEAASNSIRLFSHPSPAV